MRTDRPPRGASPDGPTFGLKKGDRPSDFAVNDLAGKEHKLSAYKGKVVFAHFASSDDGHAAELLGKVKSKHGDRVVVFDFAVDRGSGGAGPVKKASKPATVLRIPEGAQVADAWGINLFSSGVVIGPDGKVAASMPTGVRGANAGLFDDALIKRLGDYLKNPAKGW